MAYVQVPKDLTKVKSKVMFNLTKRQLICFGLAGAIGVPLHLLIKNYKYYLNDNELPKRIQTLIENKRYFASAMETLKKGGILNLSACRDNKYGVVAYPK